jgi:hypothetical protein
MSAAIRVSLKPIDVPPTSLSTSDKAYWGPRLWRIFHLLADVSDRRDLMLLWNNLMRITSLIMPCEQCRIHLGSYLRTHHFVRFPKIHLVTGAAVRAKARLELLALHNDVNTRLGKPTYSEADLAIYTLSRTAAIGEINRLFDELKVAWKPLVHTAVNGSHFTEWKKHLAMMIALATCGPDV